MAEGGPDRAPVAAVAVFVFAGAFDPASPYGLTSSQRTPDVNRIAASFSASACFSRSICRDAYANNSRTSFEPGASRVAAFARRMTSESKSPPRISTPVISL